MKNRRNTCLLVAPGFDFDEAAVTGLSAADDNSDSVCRHSRENYLRQHLVVVCNVSVLHGRPVCSVPVLHFEIGDAVQAERRAFRRIRGCREIIRDGVDIDFRDRFSSIKINLQPIGKTVRRRVFPSSARSPRSSAVYHNVWRISAGKLGRCRRYASV